MRSTLFRYSILLFLGLAFILYACAPGDPGDPPIAVTPDTYIPPTLKVTVTINEDQDASDGKSMVTLSFSTNEIKEDNSVIFTHGERVNCNGIRIDLGSTASYSVRMKIPPDYKCDYHYVNQGKSELTPIFTVHVLTQLKPKLQRPVPSDSIISVSYTPDKNPPDCKVQVTANTPGGSVTGDTVKENGNIYIGPDVSSLSGPGILVMTRTCVPPQYNYDNHNKADDGCQCNGSPLTFDKLTLTYISTASDEVTWVPPNTPTISTS